MLRIFQLFSKIDSLNTYNRICTDCTTYYRDVLSFGICFFTAANLISVLLLREHEIPVMKCDPSES